MPVSVNGSGISKEGRYFGKDHQPELSTCQYSDRLMIPPSRDSSEDSATRTMQ